MIVRAAEAGCPWAYEQAGCAYEWELGVPRSIRKAAQWYVLAGDRGESKEKLARLLHHFPRPCAPLGVWEPRWHPLVPAEIRRAMFTTMLVCNRLGIVRHIAILIAGYVCTE